LVGMSKLFAHKRLLIGLIVFVICLLLVVFLGLRTYLSWQLDKYASNVEITSIALRRIGLGNLAVDVTVRVENPNPIGATVDRIAYDLYFQLDDEWVRLGRGDRTEDIAIGANDVASVEVSHEVRTLSVVAMLLQAILNEREVTLKAAGYVWIRVGPISLEVPFEHIRALSV